MRQREALEERRRQERHVAIMLEIQRANARTAKRRQRNTKPGPPSNMRFVNHDELLPDDSPIVQAFFSSKLEYREHSRTSAHKQRRTRNQDVIVSTIRPPSSRTTDSYHYGRRDNDDKIVRSKRPA